MWILLWEAVRTERGRRDGGGRMTRVEVFQMFLHRLTLEHYLWDLNRCQQLDRCIFVALGNRYQQIEGKTNLRRILVFL